VVEAIDTEVSVFHKSIHNDELQGQQCWQYTMHVVVTSGKYNDNDNDNNEKDVRMMTMT
jgi:hypothetical protein